MCRTSLDRLEEECWAAVYQKLGYMGYGSQSQSLGRNLPLSEGVQRPPGLCLELCRWVSLLAIGREAMSAYSLVHRPLRQCQGLGT